jgi:hypothetical protein
VCGTVGFGAIKTDPLPRVDDLPPAAQTLFHCGLEDEGRWLAADRLLRPDLKQP